mmetsp:Transcript_41713/g.104813  ORF Transcript_41713/g.104813 Transcript_41713/m.104813 type:complete len:328 (-) Transcript_41713:135-1118(-)
MVTRALACAVVAAALRPLLIGAVQPKELEAWLVSPQGFGMSQPEAESLASQQWHTLTLCGIEVKDLQALKNVMFDTKGMGLDMVQLRKEIFPLAEQHVSPVKLGTMYTALTSSYTISGGLALPKAQAQETAITMLKSRAEPDELYALYKVMYGYSGLGFDKTTAQRTAISLAIAGADANTFKTTYQQSKNIVLAQNAAVAAELSGLVRRYAKDAKPYTASEFQKYYGNDWFSEWSAGPMELHVSSDHRAHTASQFARHYGANWQTKYQASAEATQKRLASDGKVYTMLEYQSYYGNSWQTLWSASPELPCSQCAPFVAAAAPVDVVV